ncbi:hypothetical protein [Geoalkalibacter halelectricus]|uniref:Uncharacterized protein n=1 Tax=Geoalkalibacter halelectricus TaxID=2847045 RepID=A0ABY5ZP47_9BACT|nr:hypothetical protein [Geoalkalibacter halelectricus]MDO3377112.1 hypothetical protein [Geoalkalibacter halelectricus]UWZ79732.1 hypothetical protein L9S41_18935 [Geoalkalibacter halelectricus]
MARVATETAEILAALFNENFRGGESERYRIGWAELRSIAGVKRLTCDYLNQINETLQETGYLLVTCDNYFVVAGENDFSDDRRVPQRLVEKYLYDEDEDSEDIDDFEAEDEDDEEDDLL